jgi:hypothetical protein
VARIAAKQRFWLRSDLFGESTVRPFWNYQTVSRNGILGSSRLWRGSFYHFVLASPAEGKGFWYRQQERRKEATE